MIHSRLFRAAVAILSAVTIVAAVAPGAVLAQQSGQPASRPAARVGTLTQPSSSGFTLETRAGSLAVTVGADTWVVVEKDGKAVEGTVADLVAGTATAVAGMLAADGKTLAARTVAQGPAARRLAERLARVPRRPLVRAMQHLGSGTITAIDGNNITLRGDRTPEVIVVTRNDTIVLRGGFADLSTLKVGEHVQVLGVPVRTAAQSNGTRTLLAWAIRVDNSASGLVYGRAASVSGNSLVLLNARGRDRITVNVDAGTQYKRVNVANGQPSISAATQADLKTGAHLAVEGPISPDGRTVQAKAVIVLGAPITPGP